MQVIRSDSDGFRAAWERFVERKAFSADIEKAAASIVEDVRRRGDDALIDHAYRYDNVELTRDSFRVTQDELTCAVNAVTPEIREAVQTAIDQVADYARHHIPHDWSYTPRGGVELGERFVPLNRVGVYVPGGTAPLISTVAHTVTLAAVAGVEQVVLTSPPGREGCIPAEILYAAHCAGVSEIYRLGGVYAIGALAFGTESVPRVEKLVGPGNAYVTAAKRQVYGHVALDMVAGPSEVLIIADHTADSAWVAADMLSQAEHGSGMEQAVLITTDERLPEQVENEVRRQAGELPKQECIEQVLENGVCMVVAADREEAAALASEYAPEHMEIVTADPEELARNISAAGAVFIGAHTPEPVGDFVAGPSHVLPTGGTARFFSGLMVRDFFRRISTVQYSRRALDTERTSVENIARTENLEGHRRSVAVRFESDE